MFPWTSSYCTKRSSNARFGGGGYENKSNYMVNAFTNPNVSTFQRPKTEYGWRASSSGPQTYFRPVSENTSNKETTTTYSYTSTSGNPVGTSDNVFGAESAGNSYRFASNGNAFGASSGGNTYTYTTTVKMEDKAELQHLNNRLAEYISKVRQLWEQRSHVDSSSFIQSIKILEEEVRKLKELYECELSNLRRQLQDTARDKNNLIQQHESFTIKIRDLEKGYAQEADKNRQLNDIINQNQQKISILEQELARLKSAPKPVDESPLLRKQVGDLSRDKEDFKGRWEKEVQMRKALEGDYAAYKKKAEFDMNVLMQQLADVKQRLEATTSTIVTLESRVREGGRSDTNIQELLRKVRLAAEDELKKHQSATDAKYSKSISALKMQMESGAGIMGKLEGEKAQLRDAMGDLKAKIAALEAQIAALMQEKNSLGALIDQERAMAAAQIREMEKRFRELQQTLLQKLEESHISQESYIPLKAEIEAMKILLAEEEKRLSTPLNYKTTITKTVSQTNSSSGGYGFGVSSTTGGGGQQSFKEYTAYRPNGSTHYTRRV